MEFESKMVADHSLVFVYGSLKRGFPLHQYLFEAEFLGDAWTEPLYFLVDCGDYPGLRNSGSQQVGQPIMGEIFRLDAATLRLLDEVEGVSESLYERKVVQLKGTFGHQRVWAWFYLSERFDQRVIGDCWL